MFPAEIIEKIVEFLPKKDFYAFAKVNSIAMDKLDTTDIWIVEFPAVISWTDTKAPYVPYDKGNFTIRHKGKEYKKEDGLTFRIDGKRIIRSDGNLELLVENLVVDNPTPPQKGVCLGKPPQTDEQFILSSLQKWGYVRRPVVKEDPYDSILRCAREEREMWSLIESEMDGMFKN